VDVDELRERNQQKAQEEAGHGPARSEPDAVPIGEAIEAFHARGDLVFGIPAHRAGRGDVVPDAVRWAGIEAFRADVGMDKGIDTRHQSWQVEPTAMQLFAQAVGADLTMFSTNGSSENVHVAMLATVRPGETIVMARNGHKSAFAALVLSGARPVYVDPVYDPRWQVAHGVDPAELQRVLDAHPETRAVMVFTPTYYGVSADVASLAAVAHAHGVPLLTDDAWGLDYSFCSRLPPSAMESGADLAIGSVHKTLTGLGQTSVLSVQGDRIDTARLQLVFELEQSTSASALLLSSIDAARRQFQRDGERLLGRAIDHAHRLRAAVDKLPGLDLMDDSVVGRPGAAAMDPTHVSFDVVGLGLTGFAAADWLRRHHRIRLELADHRRLMALVGFAHTDADLDRLIEALTALVNTHADADHGNIPDVPHTADLRMETVMLPRDAFLGETEMVPWRQAAGRISAEMTCPYPPGIPITAPGERLTTEVVDYLQQLAAAGVMVEGAADESLAEFRVVA
jgi:arginine/lysine/ornithine decarboxylase